MSIFVAGTDTDVGKTVASALIMARYGNTHDLGYWKPIATGAASDRDVTTVSALVTAFGSVHEESYAFDPPVSPHLASRLAGAPIDPDKVVRDFMELKDRHPGRHFIVEGIGGLLVPVTDGGYLMTELTRQLQLPVVLITRSTLGTINHTLLSIEALRHRSLALIGVIMNGPANPENRDAIVRFGRTAILGEIETMTEVTPTSVRATARTIDPQSLLEPHLT